LPSSPSCVVGTGTRSSWANSHFPRSATGRRRPLVFILPEGSWRRRTWMGWPYHILSSWRRYHATEHIAAWRTRTEPRHSRRKQPSSTSGNTARPASWLVNSFRSGFGPAHARLPHQGRKQKARRRNAPTRRNELPALPAPTDLFTPSRAESGGLAGRAARRWHC
jgi:hypothetical protein